MIRKLLFLILLFPTLALAIDYEANVKALSPTAWWKGYYGNTLHSDGSVATIRDFSGNSRTFSQGTSGLRAWTTRQDNRENLFTYSDQLDITTSGWTLVRVTISSNSVVAPDGNTTADTMVDTNTTNSFYAYQGPLMDIGYANVTTYAKKKDYNWTYLGILSASATWRRCFFNINTGVSGTFTNSATGTITDVGSGWYKLTCRGERTIVGPDTVAIGMTDADNTTSAVGTGLRGTYFWGSEVKRDAADSTRLVNDSAKPFYRGVSNIPALYFDGTNDYYTSTATLSNIVTADASTYFVVFRTNNDVTTTQKIFTDVGGYNQIDITSSSARFTNIDAGGSDTINYPLVANTTYILVAKHSGGNLELNLNGGTPAVPVASGTTTDLTGTLILGRTNAGTSYTNTDLTEFLVFNSALSTVNTQTVYDYLSWTLSNPWKRVEVTP